VSGTLMDYALPRATDVPRLEVHHVVTPSPLNPLGVKGAGEGGTLPAPAAIANAVATRCGRWGHDHRDAVTRERYGDACATRSRRLTLAASLWYGRAGRTSAGGDASHGTRSAAAAGHALRRKSKSQPCSAWSTCSM